MITTILLLPHADTRERLLAPGVLVYIKLLRRFGWSVPHGWVDEASPPRVRGLFDDWGCHLVLARDGAEVYEGTDRAGRVLGVLVIGLEVCVRAVSLVFEITVLLGHEPGMDPAVALERLRSIVAPLGTLVLLDADGHEVSGG